MPKLADLKDCTGCKACESICPHMCIDMRTDITGNILPSVNESQCINCGACERICPALNSVSFNYPKSAFAAWNISDSIRKESASGGIASAIYSWVKNINGISIGALVEKDWTVRVVTSNAVDNIDRLRNSKYSYSDPENVYREIRAYLKQNKTIVLIGLPCQIAGYKKTFGERDNIYYIDLVCHGVAPNDYLKQHIAKLEQDSKKNISSMSFRAPELGTSNYFFTLYDISGEIVYAKRSSDGDTYNIAFHRSYSYRENCYHCHYARPERCSDLTIGDYHGLGTSAPCEFNAENVSLILVNTDKGNKLLNILKSEQLITTFERPVNEPIQGDAQLRRPSVKSKERIDFEKYIMLYKGDFERTINKVLDNKDRRETTMKLLNIPKRFLKKLLGRE